MDINAGDTAWVLIATALVLLMTPGLAFFYGGMVRVKSALNMMLMSFVSLGIVTVLWVLYGYRLAFGDSGSSVIGAFGWSRLEALVDKFPNNGGVYPIPEVAFVAFQLMFAVITVALISGAIADRAKFFSWSVFVALWVTVVYFPVAHWVFDFGTKDADGKVTGAGWLAAQGVLDFAGGTAVHINAGAAGLALALVLGRRRDFGSHHLMRPHNRPLVLVGAGLLWFGWFGFNAGSALAANGTAALALLNTQVATGAALAGWLFVEKVRDGHASSIGAASGAVAGLVAITPACAFVSPTGAIAIGLIAGIACSGAVTLKHKFGIDDSLDVVGLHLVAGVIGCLAVGLFATNGGLFNGGGASLLKWQAVGSFSVMLYSFVATLILAIAVRAVIGFRVSEHVEEMGIDQAQHGEVGYELELVDSSFGDGK